MAQSLIISCSVVVVNDQLNNGFLMQRDVGVLGSCCLVPEQHLQSVKVSALIREEPGEARSLISYQEIYLILLFKEKDSHSTDPEQSNSIHHRRRWTTPTW